MNNLQLMNLNQWPLEQHREISHFGLDNRHFYFVDNGNLYKFESINSDVIKLCDEDYDNINSFDVLDIEQKIIITKQSILLVYWLDENRITYIDAVKNIDALSFNGTQECAVIVFEDGTLGNYSLDYLDSQLYEHGISNVKADVPSTVYVGWGSENTQFRGSEGKWKSKSKQELNLEPVTDRKPKISWRGNGEMFVVNYWSEGKRFFKVFKLPCDPIYSCDDSPGLQPSIAWRPQGNMIACSITVSNNHSIAIYEKNGYKRFSFPLQQINRNVIDMKWSYCSKILAIHQELDNGDSSLSLFTTSNYKWYLKQHLVFNTENKLVYFTWNNIISNCQSFLTVVTKKNIVTYTFKNEIHHSACLDQCVVIDGNYLLLTLFGNMKIPPPLYNISVEAKFPINFVCFHPKKQVCAIIDSSYEVSVFSYTLKGAEQMCKTQINFTGEANVPLSHRCFHWIEDQLCFISIRCEQEIALNRLDINTGDYTFIDALQNILDIVTLPLEGSYVQIRSDSVILCKDNNCEEIHSLDTIPLHCAATLIEDTVYTFVLSVDNKLFINSREISDQVTSFLIRGDYLLLTVSYNKLFCVRLTKSQMNLLYQTDILQGGFFSRNIEQSSTIVCANLNTPDIILQMPRGNIESICCYLIAIDILESLLAQNNWSSALYFIRMQRLDANLLIDLNPNRFLQYIPELIKACETTAVLNSITSEISDENVLNTKYSKWSTQFYELFKDKRKIVCEKIIHNLEEIDYAFSIEPIVFMCIQHFSVLRALSYLQDLIRRFDEDTQFPSIAEECVKLLKVYIIEDNLYNEALLTYDLKLAKYIATFCQMDPQVYEPQLAYLSTLSATEIRYEINYLLKRYNKAIIYLLRIPNKEISFILQFIKENNLSKVAYETCPKNSPYFQDVSLCYAQFLSQKGHHQEAGIVLVKIHKYKKAIDEYNLAMNWQQIVKIIQLPYFDDLQKTTIMREIASRLVKDNKFIESSIIYEQYLGDYNTAINVLVTGNCFSEALRIAAKHNQQDQKDNIILPALKEHALSLISTITELDKTFEKYKKRLQIVRDLAIKHLTEGIENDNDRYVHKDGDLFSDTESVSTRRSNRSSASSASRSRKKEQRKMLNLKEGGFYEDIALVKALHDNYSQIIPLGEEVKTTCAILLEETDIWFDDVKVLYNTAVKLHKKMQEVVSEIWPSYFFLNNPTKDLAERAILKNIEFLDGKYRIPPSLSSLTWTINIF